MSFRTCTACGGKFSAKLASCPACGMTHDAPAPASRQPRVGHQPTEYSALPPCDTPGCRQAAMCWTRQSKWICQWHFDRETLPAAQEYARKHNLVTVQDHIDHCKALAGNFAKTHITNQPVREPGED